MGQVLFASEEAQEWTPLLRDVIADRASQHGIAGLQRIQHRALRGLPLDIDGRLAADLGQSPQMCREHDADHGSV